MPHKRNVHRYQPPPIFEKVMNTLLEMSKTLDSVQTDLNLIKKIVSIEKDFVLINDDNQDMLVEPR